MRFYRIFQRTCGNAYSRSLGAFGEKLEDTIPRQAQVI